MSTTYYIRAAPVMQYLELDWSEIPEELREQAETFGNETYFVVGTRFGNGHSKNMLSLYDSVKPWTQMGITEEDIRADVYSALSEKNRRIGLEFHLSEDDVNNIIDSRKPFYSKWDGSRPVLLHDKGKRFFWHTEGREFWENIPKNIDVINNNGDLQIGTLGDLADALYGPNSTMEAVEGMRQGLYREDPTYHPSWWLHDRVTNS